MRVARVVAALFAVCSFATTARAAVVACGDASGVAGSTVEIIVELQVEGEEVAAGMQNDLEFDAGVFVIAPNDCVINPDIGPDSAAGKNLATSVLGDPTRVRNIVVANDNVNPIPSGALYTCTFHIDSGVEQGDHTLVTSRAVVSDPSGQRLPVTTGNCTVHVDPAPTPTPTPNCRNSEDCPDGQVCVDGECVTATPTNTPIGFCNDTEDCPEGQVCVDNRCVTPTPTATPIGFCNSTEDCPEGQVCLDHRCVTPTPTATPIGFCTDSEDCPLGQVCVDNRCVTVTPTATPTVKKKGGGGGGCSCEIDPRQNPWRGGDLLAILLPISLLALRRYQRQR